MYRFAVLTAVASFLLIVAGGLVTSTDSGLSVPDWPLSYGTLSPPMVGGIRFEHSHRMIAATVGLLTFILTVWILKSEPRRAVRQLAIAASFAVLLQGLLGGLTVLWHLPTPISVAHACLGQTFFAIIVLLAQMLSPNWKSDYPAPAPRHLALAATLAIYGQLILGAVIRHSGSGLHFHLAGAVLVTILIAVLAKAAWKNTLVRFLGGLLLAQLTLGGLTLFTRNGVPFATAHVAVGALLLAASVSLTVRSFRSRSSGTNTKPLTAYLELTKPRLTGLAVVSALIGFWLGSAGSLSWGKFLAVLFGTSLIGAGAGALNQYLEREADSQMYRTRNRPIPSGRIRPESALLFGVVTSIAGLAALALGANPLAGTLATVTLASYLFLYTPLKRRTALCTLIGAIPGAIPPMIGWAAARGSLGLESWLLFAILFLWQLPHFLAIAWSFREDYARAHFKMLPVLDPEGIMTGRQIALYCLALLPVSLLPTALGLTGFLYFLVALISGLAFLGIGLFAAAVRTREAAHRLFLASVIYLPWILLTMTLDWMTG